MSQPKKHSTRHYSEAQATKWLSWLAKNMQKHDQTVFLIEQLQISWLPRQLQRVAHVVLSLNIESFFFGAIAGLFGFLFAPTPLDAKLTGMVAAVGGLIVGILFTIGRKDNTIEMTGRLTWSWRYFGKNFFSAFGTGALRGAIAGLILGLFLYIVPSLRKRLLIQGIGLNIALDELLIVSACALIGGLVGAISMGLRNNVPELTTIPNEGIKRSLITGFKRGLGWAVVSWVIGGLFCLLVFKMENWFFLGMILGLTVGLPMGAFRGVMASLRHYTLRFLLYLYGYTPWNISAFLNYAVDELNLMQRVGGGYIFIHRMLLEHFAAMEAEESPAQQEPEVAAEAVAYPTRLPR